MAVAQLGNGTPMGVQNGMAFANGQNNQPTVTGMWQMMQMMAQTLNDVQGRLTTVMKNPGEDFFDNTAVPAFNPNQVTRTQQIPAKTQPMSDPKVWNDSIVPDPTKARAFLYTGNQMMSTSPSILARISAFYAGASVSPYFDEEQSVINSELQSIAVCPTIIKIQPEVVGTLRVAFISIHPQTNYLIVVSYPLKMFVESSQFQADIINLPYGFKLGADVAMVVPVPTNNSSVVSIIADTKAAVARMQG